LHRLGDHRHDLGRHLLAADLAARQAEGCLLETRRYGQPPDMAGPDFLRAMLHRPPPVASGVVPSPFRHSYNDRYMISTEHGGTRMTAEGTAGIRKSNRRYQSDVIVDLIKRYGFPYVALNPGASFRGLHDSLVNYGENDPPILLCNHEKVAVQIAHGYARASGKPMIAIVHDVVGLLHAPMGIYYAYLDRAPVFIIGATGPLAE